MCWRWPYEPSLQVPFIVRHPREASPGGTVDALAASIDVAPTLLELAGVDWPGALHGQSLVPLLADPAAPWRESLLVEDFEERVTPRCPRDFAVRTRDWKYVHYPTLEDMDELYDLARDPGEIVNLIDDDGARAARARLVEELRRLHEETENPFPVSLD